MTMHATIDLAPHPVLGDIARFLADAPMSETEFGLAALGDPNLIRQLRAGRDPRRGTVARIRNYIAMGEG